MHLPAMALPLRRTRVLVLSDIGLYRDGIARLLEEHGGLEVVPRDPDLALVDGAMRTSLDDVRSIRARWPSCRVIVLSVSEIAGDVLRFAEAGVAGYLPADASRGDLIAAIESVERGEAACSPRAAAVLLRRVAGLSGEPATPGDRLTAREAEILRLIDEGLSNKDIASRLFIGVPTVKTHVHNILRKLGATRRGQAAARVRFGV
jgi:two-component system, NarL family, nitrate/nitrite response regulator NarL